MSKAEYTVEDFMLDPEFRHWVFFPDEEAKAYWEEFLRKNPDKYEAVDLARKLLHNLSRDVASVDESRIASTWETIARTIDGSVEEGGEVKVVPLSPESTIGRYAELSGRSHWHQFYRVAGILIVSFMLGFLYSLMHLRPQESIEEVPIVYEDHVAPPGVKSNLTLQDGSRVILNSGSKLRYIKNFESDRRELFLSGEAYFEVAKDSLRPFSVRTGQVTTTALGTSFNITAYENERHDISLLTGKVEVIVDFDESHRVELVPGEALKVEMEKRTHRKSGFEKEQVLGWTKKTIHFDQTPIEKVIRVLENWYGIEIDVRHRPERNVLLSGKFVDQTLEGVLEGLSYSARFDYHIEKDRVTLTFDQ